MKPLLFCVLLSACCVAQMVDPAMDCDDEPFSYDSHPADAIGVMGVRPAR